MSEIAARKAMGRIPRGQAPNGADGVRGREAEAVEHCGHTAFIGGSDNRWGYHSPIPFGLGSNGATHSSEIHHKAARGKNISSIWWESGVR